MTEYTEQLPSHMQFPHPQLPGFTVTEIRYNEDGYYLCGWQTFNAPKAPPSQPLSPLQRMHLTPRPQESRVPSSTFHPHNDETRAIYASLTWQEPLPQPQTQQEQAAQNAVLLPTGPQVPVRFPQTGRPRA